MQNQLKKPKFFDSEYIGIDENGMHFPKSFRTLSDKELKVVLKSVSNLWREMSRSDSIKRTGAVDTSDLNGNALLEFLLHVWLTDFNLLIARHLAPIFRRTAARSIFCLGHVDFVRFEVESEVNGIDFLCNYNQLTYDLAELRVLKDGYRELVKVITDFSLMGAEIAAQTSIGLNLLKNVPHSRSPFENAAQVTIKNNFHAATFIGSEQPCLLPSKIQSLKEAVAFFSCFLTNRLSGAKGAHYGFSGILFNLNYLLEIIIRKALRSLYSDYSVQKALFTNYEINKISVFSNGKKVGYRNMRPDCVGVFAGMDPTLPADVRARLEHSIYIIDAKHKILSSSAGAIAAQRDDFYQIVAYATTHSNQDGLSCSYALVGLHDEASDKDKHFDSYVPESNTSVACTEILFDKDIVKIIQIPIRLISFLKDYENFPQGRPALFRALGLALAVELSNYEPQAARKSAS